VKDVDVTLAYSRQLASGLSEPCSITSGGFPRLNVQDLVPQYANRSRHLKNRSLIRLLKEIERTVYRHVQVITVHLARECEYMAARAWSPTRWPSFRLGGHPSHPAGGRETAYRQKAGLEGKFVVLFRECSVSRKDVDTIVEAGTF